MKKIFEKILKTVLNIAILMSFIACGNNASAVNNQNNANIENIKKENRKVLVVYFSQTGTTEGVAKIIGEVTGADFFKLEPKNPYSTADLDWTDKNSRVSKEHENIDKINIVLKNVKADNFESYDTVFIGYPIWWGKASWVVYDFIQKNDFTGKTVIPFYTSMSTNSEDSEKKLEKIAGTGKWIKGQRFPSNYNREDVKKWVVGLNIGNKN